ncbi:TPA: hypothetical protein DIC40_05545 [Patescibacteria group bacterium]|nr:hypothetical protein [Candidatus Gracilibacteria bacterium]
MLEGEVVRYVPYGVFIRVFQDINGLIHLSELSHKSTQNPNEVVKLGQIVKAKIILLDPKNRKIGLSMKGVNEPTGDYTAEKPVIKKVAAPSKKGLEDIVKKLAEEKTEEKAVEKKETEKSVEKAVEKKETAKPVKKTTKKATKAE